MCYIDKKTPYIAQRNSIDVNILFGFFQEYRGLQILFKFTNEMKYVCFIKGS